MRRILVENARRKRRLRHGGVLARAEVEPKAIAAPEGRPPDELLAVDAALDRLATADPAAAELVKLRYFAGLSIPQAAEVLGVSPRTAARWVPARVQVQEAMRQEQMARMRAEHVAARLRAEAQTARQEAVAPSAPAARPVLDSFRAPQLSVDPNPPDRDQPRSGAPSPAAIKRPGGGRDKPEKVQEWPKR